MRPRQPGDRARLKELGNAVLPQVAEVLGYGLGLYLLAIEQGERRSG